MDRRTSKQIELFFEERKRVASRREAALNIKESELAKREEELTAFYESVTKKLETLVRESEKGKENGYKKEHESRKAADPVDDTWLKQQRIREDEYLVRIKELNNTIRSLKDENEMLRKRNEELIREKASLMKRLAAI